LYCSTWGIIYRGRESPRASGQGRQQPAARVVPPQTLMGCGVSGGGSSNPSYTIF
jgi:hypothetical protein